MFRFSNLFAYRDNRPKVMAALIMAASGAIVGLMSAAVARDDAGVRQFFLDQGNADDKPALRVTVPTRTSVPTRSLLHVSVTIPRRGHAETPRVANRTPVRRTRLAFRPDHAVYQLFAADPRRPAVVSFYDDPTLRRGDAVMTMAGLRVFAGSRTFPYRPEDFTSLTASRSVKGPLRRALIELDQSPLRG